jgi:hypothetical protein
MFKTAGYIKVRIDEVKIAEPRFATGPNDFDICLRVTALDDADQTDWWRGEISENYGKGNFATQMQKDITMDRLRKLGFEGDDLTTVADQLVGKETTANVTAREYDGKTYYDVKYLGGGGGKEPEALDEATARAKIAAMFGGGGSAKAAATTEANPLTKPAATAAKKPANPFAR